MAASRNDQYQLSQDVGFQNRVQAALIAACISISNEAWSATHRQRQNLVVSILQSPTGTSMNWVQLFANTAATDTNVIADATNGGTVAITSGNRSTQAALVTDAHIDAAISSEFNSFLTIN